MIRVVEFKTEYRVGKDPVDWVLIAPIGDAFTKTQTWHRVSKIKPPEDADEAFQNSMSYQDMEAKWSVIGPRYEAWKSGTEIAVDGTPLEAWGALSNEQIKFLKQLDIRTVEEMREAGDKQLSQMRWPNARQLPELAKKFLESASVAEKDARMLEMEERIAALTELLEQKEPKRGRPRKVPEDA